MKEEPSDAMKAFMERMKKQQEGTGVRIHHMGCGEYDFSQMFPSRRKKSLSTPGGHPKSPICGHFKIPHLPIDKLSKS